MIVRKKTRGVKVGDILIGGQQPVVVQSMTNTDTADVIRTTMQVADLARAGSELVRTTIQIAPKHWQSFGLIRETSAVATSAMISLPQ